MPEGSTWSLDTSVISVAMGVADDVTPGGG
jgi:hypothetical protein